MSSIIPLDRRINLNDIIAIRYGKNYVKDPKMRSLMEINGGIHRHFLSGSEEVNAFKNNEFLRMHNSTLAKVGFFSSVIHKLIKSKLNTTSKDFGVFLDKVFESRISKFIALISSCITIILIIYQSIKFFF